MDQFLGSMYNLHLPLSSSSQWDCEETSASVSGRSGSFCERNGVTAEQKGECHLMASSLLRVLCLELAVRTVECLHVCTGRFTLARQLQVEHIQFPICFIVSTHRIMLSFFGYSKCLGVYWSSITNCKEWLKSQIAKAITWVAICLSTVFIFSPSFIHCSVANKGLVSCAVALCLGPEDADFLSSISGGH